MKSSKLFVSASALCALSLSSCTHTVPKELADARSAYRQAENGPARTENPAQLHTAETALAMAEESFRDEGDSAQTRDRAYIAQRRAERAEAEARQVLYERQLAEMEQNMNEQQRAELARLRGDYASAQQALSDSERQRQEAERQRAEAEARAQNAAAALAQVASVKQESRGMVITLSGEVLFASGKAELLPSARAKLDEVAKALAQSERDANVVVEGHTDARGSQAFNLDLSTRRAEAVRAYLTEHGVAPERVRAEGLGFSRPVADNKTAEGRANNRRVEIVVQPHDPGQAQPAQGTGPQG